MVCSTRLPIVIKILLSHLNANLTTEKPPPVFCAVSLVCPTALNVLSGTNYSLPAAEAFSSL